MLELFHKSSFAILNSLFKKIVNLTLISEHKILTIWDMLRFSQLNLMIK